MKTLQQFAKWLDKQRADLDKWRDDECGETVVEDSRNVARKAGTYAVAFGLELIECDDPIKPIKAQEVLGRYRALISPSLPKDDLTVDEAADYIKVRVRKVRSLIADGTLPHSRIGRQIRIRVEDCVITEKVETPMK